MNFKVLGAFFAGVVLCAGIVGGGSAMAIGGKKSLRKQVDVKLEWVTVSSSGSKTTDSLVLVADSGQSASSHNTVDHEKTQTQQDAQVMTTLNSDGTATLLLTCTVNKQGQDVSSASCSTTLTVKLGETKVVRSFVRKSGKDNSETLLFVTTTAN